MFNRLLNGYIFAFALMLLIGCGGTTGPGDPSPVASAQAIEQPTGGRQLWGLWQCYIDTQTGRIDVLQLRSASFTANVNNLLEAKPNNLLITDIDLTDYFTDGRLNCTVTLKHPFPGLYEYDGFDVWGVFLHNGASALHYDGLTYSGGPAAGEDEAELLNADGYTRWFNQPEFDGSGAPLLEYWPGKLGNISKPTATLNPYRIFADTLGPADDYRTWLIDEGNAPDRNIFRAGMSNSRRYELRFPIIGGNPTLDFQYAVVATWETGDPTLTGDPGVYDPGDFPASANVEEAFYVRADATNSSLYHIGPGDYGGDFKANIEVFDWQGRSVGGHGIPNEVAGLIVEGDFIPGGSIQLNAAQVVSMAKPGSGISSVFEVEIIGCTPTQSGGADYWVIVEASGLNGASYGQGFPTAYPPSAPRAAFSRNIVDVTGAIPTAVHVTSPNGGEIWKAETHHDITWTTTSYSGNVKLEYSKDNFMSDVHEIIASTPDDGIYDWVVANDPSETVKVRASLVDAPGADDKSDADFTIISQAAYDFRISTQRSGSGLVQGIKLEWMNISGYPETNIYKKLAYKAGDPWVKSPASPVGGTEYVDADFLGYEGYEYYIAGWNGVMEYPASQIGLIVMQNAEETVNTNAKWEDQWYEMAPGWILRWGPLGAGPQSPGPANGSYSWDESAITTMGTYPGDFWTGFWMLLCSPTLPIEMGTSTAYVEFMTHIQTYDWSPPETSGYPGGKVGVCTALDHTTFWPTDDHRAGIEYEVANVPGIYLWGAFPNCTPPVAGFAGGSNTWEFSSYNIGDVFTKSTPRVGFAFGAVNNAGGYGWNVDDIAVIVY
jgi:hypothetical protein